VADLARGSGTCLCCRVNYGSVNGGSNPPGPTRANSAPVCCSSLFVTYSRLPVWLLVDLLLRSNRSRVRVAPGPLALNHSPVNRYGWRGFSPVVILSKRLCHGRTTHGTSCQSLLLLTVGAECAGSSISTRGLATEARFLASRDHNSPQVPKPTVGPTIRQRASRPECAINATQFRTIVSHSRALRLSRKTIVAH